MALGIPISDTKDIRVPDRVVEFSNISSPVPMVHVTCCAVAGGKQLKVAVLPILTTTSFLVVNDEALLSDSAGSTNTSTVDST